MFMALTYDQVVKKIRSVEKISDKRLYQLISAKLTPLSETRLTRELTFDDDGVKKLCHRLQIVKRDYHNIAEISRTKGYARSTISKIVEENKDKIKTVYPPLVPFVSYNSKDLNRILKSRKLRSPYGIDKPKRFKNLAPFLLDGKEGRITIRFNDHLNIWLVVFPDGKRIKLQNAVKTGGKLKYQPLQNFGSYLKQGNEVSKKIKFVDTFGIYKDLIDFMFKNVPQNLFSFDFFDTQENDEATVLLHVLSGRFTVNRSSVGFPKVNKFIKDLNNLLQNEEFEASTNLLDQNNIEIVFQSKEAIVRVPLDKKTYEGIVSEAKVNRQLDQNFLRNYLREAFS